MGYPIYPDSMLRQESRLFRTRMKENTLPNPAGAILGLDALKEYYKDLTEDSMVRGDMIPSRIRATKEAIEKKKSEWEYRRRNCGGTTPEGVIGEALYSLNFELQLLLYEAREIEKILDKEEQKRNVISTKPKTSRNTFVGICKKREDGSYRMVDGRECSKDGTKFLDNGKSVAKYLKRVLNKKDSVCKQKQKARDEATPLPLQPV